MRLAIALLLLSRLAPAAPGNVATVELVAFVDLEDPSSARLSATADGLRKKYGARLAVRFMHFPLGSHNLKRGAS